MCQTNSSWIIVRLCDNIERAGGGGGGGGVKSDKNILVCSWYKTLPKGIPASTWPWKKKLERLKKHAEVLD